MSLEIALNEQDRSTLYAARDEILAASERDPIALQRFETLFDKQYKVNVRQIRQATIPAFLKSPEYVDFQDIFYPVPFDGGAFVETENYTTWLKRQRALSSAPPTPACSPASTYYRPSGDLVRSSWRCYGLQEDGTSRQTLQKSAGTVLARSRPDRRRYTSLARPVEDAVAEAEARAAALAAELERERGEAEAAPAPADPPEGAAAA